MPSAPVQTPERGQDFHYAVLGLPSTASYEEIRERYHALSLVFHPDKQRNKNSEELRQTAEKRHLEVQKAYEVLSDPFLRTVYDTLGDFGVNIKWPESIRTLSPKELRRTLRTLQRERMHVMYENFVRPRSETTLGYDTSSLFDDEFEDDVSFLQRSLTRFMNIKRAHFGMKYSVQKPLSHKTVGQLEARMDRQMNERGTFNFNANLYGTVAHQFSPRLAFQATTPLLTNPLVAITTTKTTFTTASSQAFLSAYVSPVFLVTGTRPPIEAQYQCQLYPDSTLQGIVQASLAPTGNSLSIHVAKPREFDLFPPVSFLPPNDGQDEQELPHIPRAGLAALTRGNAYSQYGINLAGPSSTLNAEWVADLDEIGCEFRAGAQMYLTGDIEWTVTGIWKWRPQDAPQMHGIVFHGQQQTDVRATIALSMHGVALRMEANYLGQKFTLPIVLSKYSNDNLAFWFTLLPATITSAYYCFVARPRQKTRRDRCIRDARSKAHDSGYEPRREALDTVALLADTAARHMRTEAARDGLVILNASYSAREKGKDIEGLSIDATVPLQALVHGSQLHIPALRSKAQVPGFYDPLPGAEKILSVRYTFGGRQHFAEFVDGLPVTLPLAEHALR